MKLLTELDSLDNVKDGETRKLITQTSSSGSGNVVSSVSVSGDTITYTKGVSALTAHQNAFSNVKVGSTTVAADSAGDTLELVAGSNVTLTPDATNDKVTIAATDTTYESKAAASGGTAVSLVTTGEKYTWNNKQNALSTQTAYSEKGTATKVPQITTNTLGQVTKIEEVTITQPTVNNGTLTIQKNGTDVQTFSANQSENATANITVPTKTSELTNDSGFLTSHQSLSNYVTLNSNQTITGVKTFENYNDALAANSSTKNILPSASSLSAAPFVVDFWHDHLAFLNSHTIVSNKTTDDGITWTDSSTSLVDLFNQKESQVIAILTAANLSRQIIINSSSFSYSSIAWWEFGVTYTNPFSSFKVLIERSSDNSTYSTIHESTITGNSNPYYCYGPIGGAFPYIRITFTKTSNLTTGTVSLSCIKAYSARKGNQGLGREFGFPYNWNSSRDIYPWRNNTQNLGTSSYQWKNIYAITFNGNLTGNVTGDVTGTASKATGDKNGNDITTTYVKKAGDTMTGTLTINKDAAQDHLAFGRANYNYIRATASGGKFAFLTNGKATGSTTQADFIIEPGVIRRGSEFTTADIGTSTYPWRNVYANTFNGDLTGLASKATGDKNGNDITTTYYLASNPNGYTSNTGTVTQVTAGAGLNTTSNDTATDGGNIITSGTLYLTKSGVTAGTYQGLTVDKYGRVTGATDKGYTTNTGTITGVSVNGTSVATSGVANITSMPASILSGAIPSAVTATTQSATDNSTKIATTAFVQTAIDNLPEPMVFKGSLGTGGTITSLPTNGTANIGDTYKVITAGTYASKAAKVGDTFICLTKTSSANTWELIPSGDEPSGTVTSVTIKATSPIAIDSSSAITTSGERTISHATSGVTAGTYRSVTVNSTGHVTAGTNPTTISGYGITDAKISNGTITLGSNSITPLTSEVNTNLRNGSASHSLRTTGSTAESDSYTLGQYAFAEGSGTKASGKYSHAEGDRTIASDQRAHAEGLQTQATANAAHAEGSGTIASQGYAHAEGSNTRALGFGDHAEGSSTMASGGYSHAEGYFTTACGSYSHAEGQHNTDSNLTGAITAIDTTNLKVSVSGIPRLASGDYKYQLCGTASDWDVDCYITNASYASNIYTFTVSKWKDNFTVNGTFKIFMRPVAYGNGSHAEGQATYAFSDVTHAEGLGTVANSKAQHVQGKWNVVNATYADIVGNGTDNANRSNAYTLDWDGNGIYAGKVTVGTAPANDMDVATKKYVDDNCSDTKNTAGTVNTTDKIYLAGGKEQSANPQTYSNVNCYASGGKLYSNAKEVVNLSDSQALTNKTYNGYTLAAASAKAVDTSISAASTSANLPTSAAVASFVEGKGYVTLAGDQTITGIKTFSNAKGFVYSGIETATSNSDRPVWFNDSSTTGKPVINATNFKYNPSTNILTAGTYTSTAGKMNLTSSATIQYNSTDKCIEFNFV